MKTGLVTFYRGSRYGTMLQAYALERTVEALGSECELIDYEGRPKEEPAQKLGGSDVAFPLHHAAWKERSRRFDRFRREHLQRSAHHFRDLEELTAAELPYDVILSGGGDIWNPRLGSGGHFDPAFFGAFSERRRIAYAPSFSLGSLPQELEEELKGYLHAFSHCAVQEGQDQAILRQVTGEEVPVVLDPTLLLRQEEWSAVAHTPSDYPRPERGGYILCACRGTPGPLEPYLRRLSEVTRLPVVQLCGTRRRVHPKAECILDAGPAEYLSLFQNASYVCTNEFYGTVFAVQFRKPFFTALPPTADSAPERSRIHQLLRTLGAADRIIGLGHTAGILDPVDWSALEEKLECARAGSLSYLQSALEDRPYPASPAEAGPALPRLAAREHCTGCGACRSVCSQDAITMVRDQEGFPYPEIDAARCIHCGRCTDSCPGLHQRPVGAFPAVFLAWNQEESIRRDSTSGGVFSVLAEYILKSGGVVFGAALDSRQRLRHLACFSREDLWRLRGSKYVQSELGETYREIRRLLQVRPVLFSGTPCQVDGLYRFLGEHPENLTTCDLVCQGVASPGVWEELVRSLQRHRRKKIQTLRFCNKVTNGKDSHFTIVYQDGHVDSAPLSRTEFGHAFQDALFLRPSCHHCAYTNMNRVGDFTLGSFWGLSAEELPEEQEKGISLLLVNSPHGSYLFDRLSLHRQSCPMEQAIAGNPRLASPTEPSADRETFFASFALNPFEEVRRQYLKRPILPLRVADRVLRRESRDRKHPR